MDATRQKAAGAYYTPERVVKSLVRWVVRQPTHRLLDPSCGDGRFLREHQPSVGIEQDPESAAVAHRTAPGSLVHEGDFFAWASETRERFECAVGNPPFIRYQRFSGEVRERARRLCLNQGVSIFSTVVFLGTLPDRDGGSAQKRRKDGFRRARQSSVMLRTPNRFWIT